MTRLPVPADPTITPGGPFHGLRPMERAALIHPPQAAVRQRRARRFHTATWLVATTSVATALGGSD